MRVIGWPAFVFREKNPYNWLLYTHLQRCGIEVEEFSIRNVVLGQYSLLHIHWPDYPLTKPQRIRPLIKAFAILVLIYIAHLRGIKIVWTAHNLKSHAQAHPRFEKFMWRCLTRWINCVLAMTEMGLEATRKQFPLLNSVPGFVIPHGHYRSEYPMSVTRQDAREKLSLGESARVALFFGTVSRYKNVPELVSEFRKVRDDNSILLIAGFPTDPLLSDYVRECSNGDNRVRLYLRYIQPSEVATFFRAADLVILPFRDIQNSGSAILSLSLDRPVLVPQRGAMSELQSLVGCDWVRTYSGDISSSEIDSAFVWAVKTARAERAPLERFEWHDIAKSTKHAYETIVGPQQ